MSVKKTRNANGKKTLHTKHNVMHMTHSYMTRNDNEKPLHTTLLESITVPVACYNVTRYYCRLLSAPISVKKQETLMEKNIAHKT